MMGLMGDWVDGWMKILMGIHANRHEDGCGTGWAKEQWTAGWVKASLSGGMLCSKLQRPRGVPQRYRGWEGSPWRRTRRLGGEAQGRRDIYLCHNFPKDDTPLHPSLKKLGDTDSPPAASPRWDCHQLRQRLLPPEVPESPRSCPILSWAPKCHPSPSPGGTPNHTQPEGISLTRLYIK